MRVLSLAKKKVERTLINANAGTPYPKYFKASAVNITSFSRNKPYPNNAFVICSEAISKPKHAGTDKSRQSSSDLFCMLCASRQFPIFIFLDNSGSATVPIAIPAMA